MGFTRMGSVFCETYYKRQSEECPALVFVATLTYVVMDFRKRVKNLALHPLPSML